MANEAAQLHEVIRDYVKSGARYLMVGNGAAAVLALNVLKVNPRARSVFAAFAGGLISAVLFYVFYVGYLIELLEPNRRFARGLLGCLSAISRLLAVTLFIGGIVLAIVGALTGQTPSVSVRRVF